MLRTIGLIVLLLAALAPRPAEAKTKKVRIMLIDVPPDETFKPNVTKALNDFVAGALHDQGFDVVTAQDITAVLGLEKQKQLLGCSESNCLAEIGGAMGADYIVRGNIAVLDQDTALTFSLVDSKGSAVNLQRRLVAGKSSSALIHALEEMLPKLVEPLRANPAAAPAPAGGLTSSQAAPVAGRSHTAAYALLGVGAAGLVGSGVLGLLSYSSYSAYTKDDSMGLTSKLSSDRSTANLEAGLAWGALAVGVASAVWGSTLLFSSPSPDGAPATGATP